MSLAAPVAPPPLFEGDSLTRDEFLTRWDAMPDLRHAELLEGIVYMASPVSRDHGKYHSMLHLWLGCYSLGTPGSETSLDATWLMGASSVPQPDITLTIPPEIGGQSGVEGSNHSGAPELVVEVAFSSYSRDFGIKKRLYERMGVREYLIALPVARRLIWHILTPTGYRALEPDSDGLYKSLCFPGLWLDATALWNLDLAGINAAVQRGLTTPEHAAFAAQLAAKRN